MSARVRRWLSALGLALMSGGGLADGLPTGGGTHLLIVTGLGGEAYYDQLFRRWSATLAEVARAQLDIPVERIVELAPRSRGDEQRVAMESRKSEVLGAIRRMAANSQPGDLLAIVLIGHGSAQGARVRFNLPGPDLSPTELAGALDAIRDRSLVIVNAASASGPFMPALAGPERVVITATSSGSENQHARFGGYFVAAFAKAAADKDKDDRVSLLEAFNYATSEVAREYDAEARLQTEHAMLDDNGDGEGVRMPAMGDGDGARAARVYLAAPARPTTTDRASARRQLALTVDARRLVDRIEALKRRKASLEPPDFERRLEVLLLELALNRRALRAEQAR